MAGVRLQVGGTTPDQALSVIIAGSISGSWPDPQKLVGEKLGVAGTVVGVNNWAQIEVTELKQIGIMQIHRNARRMTRPTVTGEELMAALNNPQTWEANGPPLPGAAWSSVSAQADRKSGMLKGPITLLGKRRPGAGVLYGRQAGTGGGGPAGGGAVFRTVEEASRGRRPRSRGGGARRERDEGAARTVSGGLRADRKGGDGNAARSGQKRGHAGLGGTKQADEEPG